MVARNCDRGGFSAAGYHAVLVDQLTVIAAGMFESEKNAR